MDPGLLSGGGGGGGGGRRSGTVLPYISYIGMPVPPLIRHKLIRVIRGAGRFKVRNVIGHEFCCILFELALLLVSYRTATPC